MPFFVINAYDVARSADLRATLRPLHLQRLQDLAAQDRLLIAGPTTDDNNQPTGSVVIAEFDDLSAAKAWAQDDVYLTNGVWARVETRPFHKVF